MDPFFWIRWNFRSHVPGFHSVTNFGVGVVSLATMGLYNKSKNNCYKDAVKVSCFNCGTYVFCGFTVFSVLVHMSHTLKQWIEDVATSGPRSVSAVYSNAIASMPIAPLWAILLFLMLIILGLDSQFAMIKVLISFVVDEYPKYFRKLKEPFIAGVCVFAGLYVVELFNTQAGGSSLLLLVFFGAIAVGSIYGGARLLDNVEETIRYRPCNGSPYHVGVSSYPSSSLSRSCTGSRSSGMVSLQYPASRIE